MSETVTYSKYQEAIFDTVMTTNKNIVVNATAGSGKTFTAVEIANLIPVSKQTIFVAFNKSIVEELATKLPPNIEASTLHSLGMNILMKFYKARLILNEFKTFRFSEKYLKKLEPKEKFVKMYRYKEIIDKLRMTLTEPTENNIFDVSMYYDIEVYPEDTWNIMHIMEDMKVYNMFLGGGNNVIDYVDMIHLPVTQQRLKLPQYDYTIIDELQDLNKCQREFVKRLIGDKGRFIGLGDDYQCIYSFLGADPDSFVAFTQIKNTLELPLSISYRCGKNIVKEAQRICKTIEPHKDAVEGEVRSGEFDEIQEGDFVLCRNNRPLMYAYLRLIQQGIKCTIKGKDIEQGLINMIAKWRNKSVSVCLDKMDETLATVKVKLQNKGVSKPTNHPKYILVEEKVNTIKMIIKFKGFGMTDQVIKFLEGIFSDDNRDGVQLMTIHKSKGLEAKNVFLIDIFEGKRLLPSPMAIHAWEREQERNLYFVAVTRAKEQFVFLTL